jgi:hypothetical protein
MVQAGLGKKMRLYLQNKQSKRSWKHGLSGRDVPRKHEPLFYLYPPPKEDTMV